LTFANGDVYRGNFIYGRFIGKDKMTYKDGWILNKINALIKRTISYLKKN